MLRLSLMPLVILMCACVEAQVIQPYLPGDPSFDRPLRSPAYAPVRDAPGGETRLATGDASPTPLAEVVRVINLLPQPRVAFVDYGCGSEANWCIAAAEKWRCRVVGVEIDPERARLARLRVKHRGMDNLVTIVEGDATTVDVQGDVGVVYLYPEVLVKLKPKLRKLRAFASYQHAVEGLQMQRNGDSWVYTQAQVQPEARWQVMTQPQQAAVWGGYTYSAPVCNSPNCSMCNAIRAQLWGR